MARKIEKLDISVIEDIMKDSLYRIGCELKEEKAKLLLRLLISGISSHFFFFPDTEIDVGFMKFKKNPNLDELFTVEIIRNKDVANADFLYRYYKGELLTEKELKGIVNGFVNELAAYSQSQNNKIAKLTSSLNKESISKKRKKEK